MVYLCLASLKVNGDLALSSCRLRNGILQRPATFHIREGLQIPKPQQSVCNGDPLGLARATLPTRNKEID